MRGQQRGSERGGNRQHRTWLEPERRAWADGPWQPMTAVGAPHPRSHRRGQFAADGTSRGNARCTPLPQILEPLAYLLVVVKVALILPGGQVNARIAGSAPTTPGHPTQAHRQSPNVQPTGQRHPDSSVPLRHRQDIPRSRLGSADHCRSWPRWYFGTGQGPVGADDEACPFRARCSGQHRPAMAYGQPHPEPCVFVFQPEPLPTV